MFVDRLAFQATVTEAKVGGAFGGGVVLDVPKAEQPAALQARTLKNCAFWFPGNRTGAWFVVCHMTKFEALFDSHTWNEIPACGMPPA